MDNLTIYPIQSSQILFPIKRGYKSLYSILFMPFTLYHLGGPVLLLGISVWKFKGGMDDFWENTRVFWLLIFTGSVIPDLQGFYSVFFDSSVKLHGFSHTLVGSLVYAIGVTILFEMFKFIMLSYDTKNHWLDKYKLNFFTSSIPRVFITVWLSILFLHLLPDVFIYNDMQIFWPLSTVTYGELSTYSTVASLLAYCFVIGAVLLIFKYFRLLTSKNLLVS